MQTKSDTCGIR